MGLHTDHFPVPAADSMIDSMEAKVDFKQIGHLVQMMLLRRIRHQGRLLMLHVESIDQMDQLMKRQVVVHIAGVHQVLEDIEVLESSQAAAFQFQNQVDTLKSARRDTRLGDSDSGADAALQALDATLVVLLEKQRPEGNNRHDTIILESTGLGIESHIRGALLLTDGEQGEQVALIHSLNERVDSVQLLLANHLRGFEQDLRKRFGVGQGDEALLWGVKAEVLAHIEDSGKRTSNRQGVIAERGVAKTGVVLAHGTVGIDTNFIRQIVQQVEKVLIRPAKISSFNTCFDRGRALKRFDSTKNIYDSQKIKSDSVTWTIH